MVSSIRIAPGKPVEYRPAGRIALPAAGTYAGDGPVPVGQLVPYVLARYGVALDKAVPAEGAARAQEASIDLYA